MIDGPDIDPTAAAPPPDLDDVTVPGEAEVGTVIGQYKIVDVLGEGGMGMVYAAEQEHPVRRQVALKIVKLGMDTRQVIARFEAERQALAMMDHPHVAQVYDAGATPRGRPYFAMELVKGVPITEYCDTHRLSTVQRLKLFAPICQAIQHAHHKGVIHRDIKPSNVLITIHDGRPIPKVIDFGIAKATSGSLTDKTLYTRHDQWIGTPEYMSPEQAEGSTLDIDTRSDVYSLGVLLYQLITGTLPFEPTRFQGVKYDEIRRILREEEPPLPSTRFTRTGDDTTDIARRHHTDPRTLRTELKGDLDWIVTKALDKDRTRRYETANGLALDIQRHLDHEPVLARPPSTVYRFSKLVRRNKTVFAAGLVVLVALVGGLAMASIGLVSAQRANARLQVALDETRAAKSRAETARDRAILAEALAEDRREVAEAARREAEVRGYTAALAAASAAVDRNDPQTARRHLVQTPQDLRGWEWRYLYHEADRSLGSALTLPRTPHGWSSALDPDATRIAFREIGSGAFPVGVIDLSTGQRIAQRTPGNTSSNNNLLTLSRDGRWVAEEFEATRGVRLWSLEADANEPVIEHWQLAGFLGFGPESDVAAVSDDDTEVTVFRLEDLQDVTTLTDGWSNPARSGSFSPDGKLLAVGPRAGDPIRVFSIPDGEEVARFDEQNEVVCVRFSADGTRMATVAPAGEIRVFDTATWAELTAIEARIPGRLGDIAFMRVDHRLLLLEGGTDGMLRAYRPDSGYLWWEQGGQGSAIVSIATDDADGRIVTAHVDGTVRSWDAFKAGELGVRRAIEALAFRPDSATIDVGSTVRGYEHEVARNVWTWEVLEGRLLGALRLFPHTTSHVSVAVGLAHSPDGRRLAMVTESSWNAGRLKVYDLDNALGLFMADFADLHAVAWSPDGSVIAVGGKPNRNGNTIRLFDGQSYRHLGSSSRHTKDVWSLAFSPDSALLASAGEDGTVRIWDPRTRREIRVFGEEGGPSFRSLAFTLDGARLVAGAQDGKLWIFDPLSESEPLRAEAHSAAIRGLTFLDEGRRLATGSSDSTVKFWDTGSWRELVTLHFDSTVWSLAPSPDNTRLAVGFGSGRLRILDTVDEAARGRQRRVERDARNLARPLVVDLVQRIDDPKRVRERIEQDTTLTEVVRAAALRELIVERDKTLADAYAGDRVMEVARPIVREHILREKMVVESWGQYDLEPAAERIRRMPDLSEAERQAAAEYAVALKGQEFAFDHRAGWSHRLACEILWDPERTSEDYALALGWLEAFVKVYPDAYEFQATLVLALYRMHELDAAREVLTHLQELRPWAYDPWALSRTALILVEEPEADAALYAAAIKMAQVAAAQAEPHELEIQERLAQVVIRTGEVDALTEVVERLDPRELNNFAWQIAREPGYEPPLYAAATKLARSAVEGVSDEPAIAAYANTLGVALYRAGSYEEAILELRRSDDLLQEQESGRVPHNSAFIAMSLHRLGRTDEAANEYARLERQMSREQWAEDAEAVSFFNEARELLGRQ